jgi:hypothetical protein
MLLSEVEISNPIRRGGPRALHAPASETPEHSVALRDTNDVLRRFDRDSKWLATLMVSAMVCAALMLALLVQDRYPKAADLTDKAVQLGGDLLLNANSATLFRVMGLNEKSSNGNMTSGEETSVTHAFTRIPPQENPSSQMEAAASTPTPVPALTPEINRQEVQPNASSLTPAHRQDSGRVIGLKVQRGRSRSYMPPRYVDVKTRLIALWHQSLMRSEKSRSWTLFSNSNKGERKKVSYTAETNH